MWVRISNSDCVSICWAAFVFRYTQRRLFCHRKFGLSPHITLSDSFLCNEGFDSRTCGGILSEFAFNLLPPFRFRPFNVQPLLTSNSIAFS